MKLTTKLLDTILSTAKGTSPNQGVLALLCLFARSHNDNTLLFKELHDAHGEARERALFLHVFVLIVLMSVLASIMTLVSVLHSSGALDITLVGIVTLFFCWFSTKIVVCLHGDSENLVTKGRPALEKFRQLCELIRDRSNYDVNDVLQKSHVDFDLSNFKSVAWSEATDLATQLFKAEDEMGRDDPRTEEIRHMVFQKLLLLSTSGLIASDWKAAYLGKKATA